MNHKTPSLAGMGFPGLYVQCPGAIGQLKQLLSEGLHAHSATLIYDRALEKYLSHFHASGVAVHALPFPGECSTDVIAGLVANLTGFTDVFDCVEKHREHCRKVGLNETVVEDILR